MEGKGVDIGFPRTRPTPESWLKGCGGMDGGILVGDVEV